MRHPEPLRTGVAHAQTVRIVETINLFITVGTATSVPSLDGKATYTAR